MARITAIWTLVSVFLLLAASAQAQTCAALFTFYINDLTVQFMDQSTHAPNDPIVSWDWDFDDGGSSSQQNPTHTFPEPDRYDVVLTITTQNGCVSSLEIRIEICALNVNYDVGVCNAQMEVPVNINITDVYDNANEIDVILDGQSVPGSPFLIDAQNPVNLQVIVPGDGLAHTIQVQSLDIETCGTTIEFTVEDCMSDCFLSSLQVDYSPGTTHNVTVDDNFFAPQSIAIVLGDIVRFNWAGGGHSSTSDATSSPDAWNSGVIGAGSTFDVSIQQPGTHNYYCIPHGGPNGVGMSGQILSNCPTGTSMNLQVNFSTSVANGQGYQILWDNVQVTGSPFNYNGTGPQSQTISIAGDGMAHTLVVRDVADPTCDIEMQYNAPDCGQGGGNPMCSISGTIGNFGVCNNMNVTANLSVQVTNGGTGFGVSIDGSAATSYTYTGSNTNVIITLPGDGASHTVVITDSADPACTSTITTTTPDCNLPCGIANLTAAVAGSSGSVTHTVAVEDFQFNPNSINITVGDVVMWIWNGAIAHSSTSDQSGGPDSWDSGLLGNGAMYISPVLSEGVHSYYCIPHGAPGGIGMAGSIQVLPPCNDLGQSTVVVQFNVTNGSASGYQVVVDGVSAGTFAYVPGAAQSASVLIHGDGALHTIIVQDLSDMACNASTGVVTPDCSGSGNPCMVSLSPAIVGGCINSMVAVALNVTASNAGSSYSVTIDGQAAGTFDYSDSNVLVSLAGDGQSHTIVVVDTADSTCRDTAYINTPDCGQPCGMITNLVVHTDTNIIHTVEVRDFDFAPQHITVRAGEKIRFIWTGIIPHTVTSDAVTGPEVWDSGLLGQGAVYEITINTPGEHPYYCIPHGGPGGVGMAGTITVLPDCLDNTMSVQVHFDVDNGSVVGYNVMVDSVLYGNNPNLYQNTTGHNVLVIAYPADSSQHTITIQDALYPTCIASGAFTTGICNVQCQLSGLDVTLGNGRRHEVEVKDFEFAPASLQIELGDTIHFVWTGAIPHTVTSDASTGPDVFNSGLLGNGAAYDLVLTTTGSHPYYCIPHGAPGGIGMAGQIDVVDPCDDGQVFVDFSFFASTLSPTYDVLNQGNVILDNVAYVPGGIQMFTLELDAQGQSHLIEVVDNGPDSCTVSFAIDSFDCNDPCFLVNADFVYDINYSTLEVTFMDDSRGDIVSWHWDFGDGTTSDQPNPTHTFPEPILYEVCLTVTDSHGCGEVHCDKLRLGADVCRAGFTFVQDGLDVVFYNTSDVSNPVVTALWNFSDGTTSELYDSTTHAFVLGIYEVCLTVTAAGCTNTLCQTLDLSDPCLALRAGYQAETIDGNPLVYQFTDQSEGPVGTRLWGFGDGAISSETNPTHSYASIGVYTVCLLTIDTEGNCTNSDCRSLFVGTTSNGPQEILFRRMQVAPNPTASGRSVVSLRGFEAKDHGARGWIQLTDLKGVTTVPESIMLDETVEISTTLSPGLYYIQVVSARKTYGAKLVVQ